MPGYRVRDLLIRLMLNTDEFKNSVKKAKDDLGGLKGKLQEVSSDDSFGIAGDKVLKKLETQRDAAQKLVDLYKGKVDEIKKELESSGTGTQKKTFLETSLETFQGKLESAQETLSELQGRVDNFSFEKMIENANSAAAIFSDLRLGFGGIFDGAGDFADSADQVFASRESAFKGVTKILKGREGYTEEWGEALDKWNHEVIERIPVAYEALAQIEADALQAGGVSKEGLREFTETYAALQSATNIQGEAGAKNFGKYLSVMDVAEDEMHRLGSVVVEMGNRFASLEDQIVATARRSGSAMRAAGISAQDGLALATAATAMGMEQAAAATSLEKVIGRSAKAAELGFGEYQRLLTEIQRRRNDIDTVYDFQIEINSDPEKDWFHELEKQMHMTKADLQRLVNNAIVLEKYSDIMGITPEEFSRQWTEDAGQAVLAFFERLGEMDQSSFTKMYEGLEGLGSVANDSAEEVDKGILTLLDSLGITEVRASRLARNFALNNEDLRKAVELARKAYEEDKALDEEAQERYKTTDSRRQMNKNIYENALQATGRSVVAMRKPFEDFFAQLQQWYTEDWPAWAQDGIGAVTTIMGTLGDGLKTAGDLSFSFASILNAGRELNKTEWGGKVLSGLKTAGKIGLGAGAIAGTYLFAQYLADAADSTDDIAEKLSSLEFKIDEQSKEATLSAIHEVRDAADELSGADEEKYAGTSKIVQMGYGTSGMYGQALEYERLKGEKTISDTYSYYGNLIHEQEEMMLAAQDDASRKAVQERIEAITQEMEAAVADQRARMSQTLNAVINGAIEQTGSGGDLESISRQYNALDMVFSVWNDYLANGQQQQKLSQTAKETLRDTMNSLGYYDWAKQDIWGGRNIVWDRLDATAFKNMANFLYENLAADVEDVASNGGLMSVLSAALSSGALDSADQSQFSGAFLTLLQAMDIKAIADKGVNDWQDVGRNSMLGLGQGIDENSAGPKSSAENAAQSLIDAAKAVLREHSPSQEFYDIGLNIDAGLAAGILDGADDAVNAAEILAARVADALRTDLDIHSPSRVAEEMGNYFSLGLAKGIEDGIERAVQAASRAASSVSGRRRADTTPAARTVHVTLNMNGKQMAEAMVPFIDEALGDVMWNK